MVNIVTIEGKSYLVDVAFGSNGPCRPIPLQSGLEFGGIYPVKCQLEYKALAEHTDPKQRAWVFSSQADEYSPWTDQYAFVEIEFFPADFEVMNLATMTAPQSFFVQTVVATKIILNQESQEPEGVLILHKDYVKMRIGESTVIVETLNTEAERVRALRYHFMIDLKPEEQRAIRGLPSELKSGAANPGGLS